MSVNPILVKDDILDISSQSIDYAVNMGGSNTSSQKFVCNSISNSSSVYVIQVPSLQTVVSRTLLRHERFTLTIEGVPRPGQFLVDLGESDAFAPMPLSQLIKNTTCQINNTSVSLQTQEVIDPLLRVMEREALSRVNNTAPCYLDQYADYIDCKGSANNPLGGYDGAVNPSYPPRGSYKVISITGNAVGETPTPTARTVNITVEFTEPVFLSPFVFGDTQDDQPGMCGVNTITITDQRDATAKLCYRFIDDPLQFFNKAITSIQYSQQDCYMECQFVSPHPSMMLPSRSISPYIQYNLFKSSNVPANTATSSAIQLNGVPDKVLVWVRSALSTRTGSQPDYYATITGISINFNNGTYLSNASKHLLWKYSQEASNNQSWLEWSGEAYSRQGAEFGVSPSGPIATTGSVLALDFGRHITLDAFLAPGSSGSFNFSITVNYETPATAPTLINPELCLLFLNSGVFVNESGQSSVFVNLLTKTQVLDSQALQEPTTRAELRRLVGGGFLSNLKHLAKKAIKHLAPHVIQFGKEQLSKSSHPLARVAEKGIEVAGYGMSAGGMSAGRMRKHLM
jgi:hypothetical protein